MNQSFRSDRLGLLIASHWAENKKKYTLSFFAMVGLMLLWLVFIMMTDPSNPLHPNLQHITFFFSLFLAGPFYASQFFGDISSKSKGLNYLLVPASILEKTICAILYAIPFFFIAFTIAYYLADGLAVMLANAFHDYYTTMHNGVINKATIANVFLIKENENFNLSKALLLLFLAVQSLSLLGSIYFTQYSYIKTAITICLLLLLFFLIESYMMERIMPRGGFSENFSGYVFYDNNGGGKLIQLPKWIGIVVGLLVQFAFPPIFWATTYFRLKEKEI